MNLNVLQNEIIPVYAFKPVRNSHGQIPALSYLRGDMNILDGRHPEIRMNRESGNDETCMCGRFVM